MTMCTVCGPLARHGGAHCDDCHAAHDRIEAEDTISRKLAARRRSSHEPGRDELGRWRPIREDEAQLMGAKEST